MSKKVMILVVIIECILAILLIAVIGKAVESYYKEVKAREIYFTTMSTDVRVILKEGETQADFERTPDGRVILKPGMVYNIEKNTVESLPNKTYTSELMKDDIIIEYVDPENIVLPCVIMPGNATDQSVKYTGSDEDNMEIDATGHVLFFDVEQGIEKPVLVSVTSTKTGTSATVQLIYTKKSETSMD